MPTPVATAAPTPPPRAFTPALPAITTSGPPANGDIIAASMHDMPEPVRPEAFIPWTGAYFGPNIGYGTTHGGTASNCFNSVTNDPTGCVLVGDTPFNTRGVAGGGQVGYMMPVHLPDGAPVMVGVEADVQDSGVSGSQRLDGPFAFSGFPGAVCSPCSYTAAQSLDWFGTVRLRFGVPVDNFLLYVTGGAIIGGVKTSQNLSFAGTPGYVVTNNKQTLAGPTVGGGVEVLLPDSMSAKLEALYYDLGTSSSVTVPQTGFAGNFFTRKTFGFRGALVRLGLNFRLGDIGAY
jgi:opacity protein-like surface antigen